MMLGSKLKDVAAKNLSMVGLRGTVYSGLGPFYDNKVSRYLDDIEESGEVHFLNDDDPIILDFWDEWTTMASLIRCGYLKLFEKVSTFGVDHQDNSCQTCHFYNVDHDTCPTWQAESVLNRMKGCPFWTMKAGTTEYKEVTFDEFKEPLWKQNYLPIRE